MGTRGSCFALLLLLHCEYNSVRIRQRRSAKAGRFCLKAGYRPSGDWVGWCRHIRLHEGAKFHRCLVCVNWQRRLWFGWQPCWSRSSLCLRLRVAVQLQANGKAVPSSHTARVTPVAKPPKAAVAAVTLNAARVARPSIRCRPNVLARPPASAHASRTTPRHPIHKLYRKTVGRSSTSPHDHRQQPLGVSTIIRDRRQHPTATAQASVLDLNAALFFAGSLSDPPKP
jgi:hypothetical protein